ncbi:hypothetical protein R9X47_07150 [Wukongibacter baidiensis]|uniref:hypothetical protein n=1 Tax=Wukongibacter baidiensis TaxID=1723361 RepID=UPI003D7F9EC1
MKKSIFIYATILALIILFGMYYWFGMGHHNFYSSICGSGINGIKMLLVYYLPLLLLILIIIFLYRYKQTKIKCRYCSASIENELSICPYCGNSI